MTGAGVAATFRRIMAAGARSAAPLCEDAECLAGERFCLDFLRSQATARTTATWSPVADSGHGATYHSANAHAERLDRALMARERYERAVAVVGEQTGRMLIDIGCCGRSVGDVEKAYGLPQRSGKVAIAFALRPLAIHYGLRTRGGYDAQSRHA